MKLQILALGLMASIAFAEQKTAVSYPLTAPAFYAFDDAIPSAIKFDGRSRLSLTSDKAILGLRSLRWDWAPGAVLNFNNPVDVAEGAVDGMPALSTFGFWVYNRTPRKDALRVTFYVGGKSAGHYDFGLNFIGWRTAWVRPGMDLVDYTGAKRFDGFTLTAPSSGPAGSLLIDELVPSQLMDRRYQIPDYQVTTTNDTYVMKEWIGSRRAMELEPTDKTPPTPEEISATERLAKRVEACFLNAKTVDDGLLRSLRARVLKLNLQQLPDGSVSGAYIPIKKEEYIYPPGRHEEFMKNFEQYDLFITGRLMRDIAEAWHSASIAQRPELAQMYVLIARHMLDLGWAEGSGRGAHNHIGYPFRDYGIANFLMRDVLNDAGLLEPVSRAMQFYTNARRCVEPPLDGDLDYQNTIAPVQLMTLLMIPDEKERVLFVRALAKTVDQTIAFLSDDSRGGYKRDGTAFHHWGHYPGYGIPAMSNSSQMALWLADTPFRLSPAAYENLGRAIMASEIYTNRYDWPNAMAGRHPFGAGNNVRDRSSMFLDLALAGNPDGSEPINREAAAAYLAKWPDLATKATRDRFAQVGVQSGMSPSGHWTFPFAAASIHRRDDWMVSIKGYNRYVWSSEIYARDNRYGRYQSNGAIEILLPGGMQASGYRQEGWDWNRVPGATILRLPIEQLDPASSGTVMYTSPETFTGGSTFGGRQGVFGFILNEANPGIFKHGLHARKSIFSFDERIIALSTGITCSDPDHPVETVLFQNALPTPETPISVNGQPITEFPFSERLSVSAPFQVITDTVGNSFYVPGGQSVGISREAQVSRHNKTREETKGNFSAAWIDQGVSPKDARSEFAILVQTPAKEALEFAVAMQDPAKAAYHVLSQTQNLHAVYDRKSGIHAYVAYDPVPLIDEGPVAAIGQPALVMTDAGASDNPVERHLSVCVPDIRLPMDSQKQKDLVIPDGAIADANAEPFRVTVQLRGRWSFDHSPNVRLVSQDDSMTTFEFLSNHGETTEVAIRAEAKLAPGPSPVTSPSPTSRPESLWQKIQHFFGW